MSGTGKPHTYFDSPERSFADAIASTAERVAHAPLLATMLEAYPTAGVVLDEHRQIVAFNAKCRAYFGDRGPAALGLRLGEAIDCAHATEMEAGCGTSLFCRDCGMALAVKAAHEKDCAQVMECRITALKDGSETSLDFRVHVSPITVDGKHLLVAAIQDIADEKRRQALERIFFHDVANTAETIRGISRLLPVLQDRDRVRALLASLGRCANQLVEEIQAQRDLVHAERGELAITLEAVSADSILFAAHEMYWASRTVGARRLVRDEVPADVMVKTDRVQAIRCLGNLIKNALEATRNGGEVRLYGEARDSTVAFHVKNEGVLGDRVRRQIFQRSFSTKAPQGRGIGTYSVKLMVEQHLGGRVSFVSDPEHGTIFTIELPRG